MNAYLSLQTSLNITLLIRERTGDKFPPLILKLVSVQPKRDQTSNKTPLMQLKVDCGAAVKRRSLFSSGVDGLEACLANAFFSSLETIFYVLQNKQEELWKSETVKTPPILQNLELLHSCLGFSQPCAHNDSELHWRV